VSADPWDEPAFRDDSIATLSELAHGSDETHDLKAKSGSADEDWFRIRQEPFSSYEVVVDAAVGDLVPVVLERVAADGTTVLQTSDAAGLAAVRSLRFENATAAAVDDQFVVVRSGGCTKCKARDTYRIRAFDTTYTAARFNNAATQVTILVVQNPTNREVVVTPRFWNATGVLSAAEPQTILPKGSLVLATETIAPDVSGSVTVTNDARYGELDGKTLSLEAATGFSFDTALRPRPH
jgi:hypothetical protein